MRIAEVIGRLRAGDSLLVEKAAYPDGRYRIRQDRLEFFNGATYIVNGQAIRGIWSAVPSPLRVLAHICKRKGWYQDAGIKMAR